MEINDDQKSVFESGKSFSVPGFLRKVFTNELGEDIGLNHKLLAVAVRAVLLESGFIEFDPNSNSSKSNTNWHDSAFFYTLPDIINDHNVKTDIISSIKIKFQNLGKYFKVYGSLINGPTTHWVLLDEEKLVPFLNIVWANYGQFETIDDDNPASSVSPEKEVFEFWRKVKDELVLPLLIDLCENARLELPPCFMNLPTELKLKIFEHLSGLDLAVMSCVCSEVRYLGSSDDLWKRKYFEEFGSDAGTWGKMSFKGRFAYACESRKRRKATLSLIRNRNAR